MPRLSWGSAQSKPRAACATPVASAGRVHPLFRPAGARPTDRVQVAPPWAALTGTDQLEFAGFRRKRKPRISQCTVQAPAPPAGRAPPRIGIAAIVQAQARD